MCMCEGVCVCVYIYMRTTVWGNECKRSQYPAGSLFPATGELFSQASLSPN